MFVQLMLFHVACACVDRAATPGLGGTGGPSSGALARFRLAHAGTPLSATLDEKKLGSSIANCQTPNANLDQAWTCVLPSRPFTSLHVASRRHFTCTPTDCFAFRPLFIRALLPQRTFFQLAPSFPQTQTLPRGRLPTFLFSVSDTF